MTPAESVLRVRAIYDENGVSSGFLDNTNDIYKFIDSGHTELITLGVLKLRRNRLLNDLSEPIILKPLIKLDTLNTTTVGAGYQEYNLPSDYLDTYRASYDSAGTTNRKNSDLMTFEEVQTKSINSLTAPDTNNPVYYIRLSKIGFFPQPSGAGANAYEHFYIYKPTEINSGTSAFALGVECHEAIVKYAAAMSLLKDGENSLAENFLKQFYEIAGQL